MKFPRLSPRAGACLSLLALAVSLRAQQPSPSPVDAAAVLAAIKELKTKQPDVIAREKGQVLDAIRAALADPIKAYEQATVAVEFQGKGGGNDSAKLMEWRKQNGELLRDRTFANALRLELAYLGLTWQRCMGTKTKDLLPALYDYTSQVTANYEALWTLKMADKSFNDIVFVPYFQIGPFINSLPDWDTQPFDVDGIFQKTILPELRKEKDPRLLVYWDAKIQSEALRTDKQANGLAANRFNSIRRPALLWNRAEDELVLGDQGRAVADMLALLKAHPDHPDFDKWVARLTDVVTPKADASAVPPASPHP